MSIDYTDGKETEAEILRLLQSTSQLDSLSDPFSRKYHNWAIRYHLSSTRSNLLRHFDFSGMNVLEVGAGMGAISRYLAENSHFLQVVEGTESRFKAISARLRDLDNWEGSVVNFQDYQTEQKFDVVCMIGVLEYSPMFLKGENGRSAFDAAFQFAQRLLVPGGCFIVAIENPLGLKYWNGSPEDHTNRMFDGITGYGMKASPKTLSKRRLLQLFHKNGFAEVDEFYPFPDYKVPRTIFHSSAFSLPTETLAELACMVPFESYGLLRTPIFPDYLAASELARAGLLQDMSNSFLFVGHKDKSNNIGARLLRRRHLGECAWYYTERNPGKILTQFNKVDDYHTTSKSLISSWNQNPQIEWFATKERLLHGDSIREILERSAYHSEWEIFFNEITEFLHWLITTENYRDNHVLLVDAAWKNARKYNGGYGLFDQEWRIPLASLKLDSQTVIDWILFHNISLLPSIDCYWSRKNPWKNLKKLYEKVGNSIGVKTDFERSLQLESSFRVDAGHNSAKDADYIAMEKGMRRLMTCRRRPPFITEPVNWTALTRYGRHIASRIRRLHGAERRLREFRQRT